MNIHPTDAAAAAKTDGAQARTVAEADVVVVGGGGSGLAAAIEAATLGRSVILLEKDAALGGSTGRSVGSITVTNTPHQIRKGIRDSAEHHFEDMAKFNAVLGLPDNLVLRRMLVENVNDTFRWLMSMGIEFFGPMAELPHRKPRMHNILPNSRAYIYHLSRRARRLGVDIRTSAPARKLVRENGRVVGVVCDTANGPAAFRARGGVVLCSGDYSASTDMRRSYLPAHLHDVEPVNPHNTGDGHRMVLDIGGRVLNTHIHTAGIRFQAPAPNLMAKIPPYRVVTRAMNLALEYLPGWLLRPFIMSFLTTVLVPSPKMFKQGAILINAKGERFANEAEELSQHIAKQPGQLGYIVLDAALTRKFSAWPYYVSTAPGFAYAFTDDYRRNRKDIYHQAETLAELAAKIGAPANALEETVAAYNASQERAAAGRAALGGGPYVAMGPVRYYINFTDGTLAVNERLEVLGADDQPVPGLYAAGFTGMGGVLLEGHGHHLGWVFTSGRLAGRRAAMNVVTADIPEAATAHPTPFTSVGPS